MHDDRGTTGFGISRRRARAAVERARARDAPGRLRRVPDRPRGAARGRGAGTVADRHRARAPICGRASQRGSVRRRPRTPTTGHGARFAFTLPQLVAASLALMVASGGMVWLARMGGPSTDFPRCSATPECGRPISAMRPTTRPSPICRSTLDAGRGQLDPQTIRVLEANLRGDRSRDRPVPRGPARGPVERLPRTPIWPRRGAASWSCCGARPRSSTAGADRSR